MAHPRFPLTHRVAKSIIPAVTRISAGGRGFTLVELLVVISVLGILLAFFVPPTVSRIVTNTRKTATVQELGMLRDAIAGNPNVQIGGEMVATGFKNDVGRLPRDLVELATRNPFEGIYASVQYLGKETLPGWDPYIQRGWNGPYVREDGEMGYKFDAWGSPYEYYVEGTETLGLKSRGPDGLWFGQPGALTNDDIIVRF